MAIRQRELVALPLLKKSPFARFWIGGVFMQINPKDLNAINHLADLERAGEKGFEVYYSGDVETGSKVIQDVLKESKSTIRSIGDSVLKEETKKLFDVVNKSLQEYIKNPSKDNFNSLNDGIDNYKSFLDENKS